MTAILNLPSHFFLTTGGGEAACIGCPLVAHPTIFTSSAGLRANLGTRRTIHELAETQLSGPDFRSFFAHSHSYESANDQKSDLKLPNFRFAPHSPTGS